MAKKKTRPARPSQSASASTVDARVQADDLADVTVPPEPDDQTVDAEASVESDQVETDSTRVDAELGEPDDQPAADDEDVPVVPEGVGETDEDVPAEVAEQSEPDDEAVDQAQHEPAYKDLTDAIFAMGARPEPEDDELGDHSRSRLRLFGRRARTETPEPDQVEPDADAHQTVADKKEQSAEVDDHTENNDQAEDAKDDDAKVKSGAKSGAKASKQAKPVDVADESAKVPAKPSKSGAKLVKKTEAAEVADDEVVEDADEPGEEEVVPAKSRANRPVKKAKSGDADKADDADEDSDDDEEEAPHQVRRSQTQAPVVKKGHATHRRNKPVEVQKKRISLFAFIRQSVAELRKVVWPKGDTVGQYFIVVFVFVVFIMLVVAGLDAFFGWGLLRLFR